MNGDQIQLRESLQPTFDVTARVATAVSAALIAVAFGTVSLAHAAPLAPTAASQLVTAVGVDTECAPGAPSKLVDQQQNADGTTSPFVVPAKSVFVMTSYEFNFRGIGNGVGAFQYMEIPLILVDATVTHISYVSIGGVVTDSTGSGSGTVLLPSGVAMKAGTRLCFQFSSASSGSVFVHGFFAKDK